jgi:hypothetical protein
VDTITLEQKQDLAQRELDEKYQKARDAENQRIADEREAAITAAQAAEDAERRAAEEAALRERLKTAFLTANPSADDADFVKAWPRIREEHFIAQARIDPVTAEAERLRERYADSRATW